MSPRVKISQTAGEGPARIVLSVEIESDYVLPERLAELAEGLIERVGVRQSHEDNPPILEVSDV